MTGQAPLLIVGGGMAAGRLLRRLVELGYDRPITVVSAEAEQPYNRVLLPDLLSGRCTTRDLTLHDDQWYAQRRILFLGGNAVIRIDRENNRVHCEDGTEIGYHTLILATGATVPAPNVPGLELQGVTVLRTIEDARALRHAAGSDVCIVGGGLLGLETARSLAAIGARVSVVHRAEHLLNRQLDAHGSAVVRDFLEEQGIDCRVGESVAAIEGTDTVSSVHLSGGGYLTAQWVVFATGTRPNDDLARAAGIATDDGIIATDRMETSDPQIAALGECARVDGTTYAMVEPVYRQADVLANRLTGGCERFAAPAQATRLKIAGLAVFAAGQVSPVSGDDDVIIEDPARRVYRRLCFRGDRLTGAVLIGDSSGGRAVQHCLQTGGRTQDPLGLAFGAADAA